jgi:glycosyltransferase involved in cell wall biosynthesis
MSTDTLRAVPSHEVEASVIIGTYNRCESLDRTLVSLAHRICDVVWEIIVVDNNCEDETADRVAMRAVGFPVPLRLERERKQGISPARNRGVASANGRFLIFTDDDVICHPNFVAAHVETLSRPGVCGASGRIVPILPPGASDLMRAVLLKRSGGPAGGYGMGDEEVVIRRDGKKEQLPFGANMSIHRRAALQLGGFRTDLGLGRRMLLGEETHLFQCLLDSGKSLIYQPAAVVEHYVQPDHATHEYYLRWWNSWGRSDIISKNLGVAGRGRRLAGESLRMIRAGLRLARTRRNALRYIEAQRKLAICKGRMSELVGR